MTYRKLSEKYNYKIYAKMGLGLILIKIYPLEDKKMATRSNVFCRQHHSVDVLEKNIVLYTCIYFNFCQ